MKSNTRRNARVYCGMSGRAEGPTGPVRGVVRNLSKGGMFFLAGNLLPVGSTYDLAFELPGEPPIRATGEVRYHYKYADGQGMGIRFVRLAADDLAVISRYVSNRVAATA